MSSLKVEVIGVDNTGKSELIKRLMNESDIFIRKEELPLLESNDSLGGIIRKLLNLNDEDLLPVLGTLFTLNRAVLNDVKVTDDVTPSIELWDRGAMCTEVYRTTEVNKAIARYHESVYKKPDVIIFMDCDTNILMKAYGEEDKDVFTTTADKIDARRVKYRKLLEEVDDETVVIDIRNYEYNIKSIAKTLMMSYSSLYEN